MGNLNQSPFPEGSILQGIWQLNNLDVILAKMNRVLHQSKARAEPYDPTLKHQWADLHFKEDGNARS